MRNALRISVSLTVLIVLSIFLLTLGRYDTKSYPAASSFGPSGTSALAELLRQNGYQVRLDNGLRPKLSPDETAVLVYLDKVDADENEVINGSIERFVKSGGCAVLGVIITKFEAGKPNVQRTGIGREDGDELIISQSNVAVEALPGWEGDSEEGWYSDAMPVTTNWSVERGLAVVVHDSIFLTNRYLDEADNARLAMNLFDSLSTGKKVVFLSASYGDGVDDGLLTALSPFARFIWLQSLLLGLVVFVTLGKRFGLPVMDRAVQGGQRQLVDAISFLMRRTDAKPFVATTLLKAADRQIRRTLKLPADAPLEQRDRELPESLQKALYLVQRAGELKAPDDNFLAVTQKLERELEEFARSRSIVRDF